MKTNPKNERIKRAYFRYLKEARQQGEQSVDAVAAALDRFEDHTKRRDFSAFHVEQAVSFKAKLAQQRNGRTKELLSKSTQVHMLASLKAFLTWLAGQPGYKSRIAYSDAEYFNASFKDTAIARADRGVIGPTVEQVRYVLSTMPDRSDIEKRNRAVLAFAMLTGARDNAIASLKLKHLDVPGGKVIQDAREVRTKAAKTITTWFFPVGEDIRAIVGEWALFLRRDRLWSEDDPLFPKTKVIVGRSGYEAAGLKRENWSTAAPIRAVFRQAFSAADLPCFNPHSLRNTLARLGEQACRNPEELKAWSQNLGHESVLTTLRSYGQVDRHRQADIMAGLASRVARGDSDEDSVESLSKRLAEKLSRVTAGERRPNP